MSQQSHSNAHQDDPPKHSCHWDGHTIVAGEILVKKDPGTVDKEDAEQQQTTSRDKIRLRVEILTLIFVVLYATIAAIQLWVMKDTAVKQLSAYVFVDEVSIVGGGEGSPWLLTVKLKNSGETPARNVNATKIGVYQAPAPPINGLGDAKPNRDNTYEGNIPPKEIHGFAIPIPKNFVDDIRTNTRSVVVFGDIDYKDIFGNRHITQFCQSETIHAGEFKDQPESFTFGTCLVHNCDDDDCKSK